MQIADIHEAESQFSKLVERALEGEEVIIADQGQPLAKLVRSERTRWPCKAGSAKDKILWIAPDFDAPLDDFEEYME